MGFEAGFNSGFNAGLNRKKLQAEIQAQQSQDRITLSNNVNTNINDVMASADTLTQNLLAQNTPVADIELQVKPLIDQAISLSEKSQGIGLNVTSVDSIRAKQQAMLSAPSQSTLAQQEQDSLRSEEQIKDEVELSNLEERETIKARVKRDFEPKTEVETLASLMVKEELTPEEAATKKLLQDKLTKQSGSNVLSRPVTVLNSDGEPIVNLVGKNGQLLPVIDSATGKPAVNATELRQRRTMNRLEGSENRKALKDLDKQYKDFADKSKSFMNQMDAYNSMLEDSTPADQSVLDQTLSMAYIRSIKPSGTISSNADFDNIDALRSIPEAIRDGVKASVLSGKVLAPRVRNAITKLMTEKYNIAKSRESSVIANAKSRAEGLGVQWTPPVYVPSQEGVELVDDEEPTDGLTAAEIQELEELRQARERGEI
jgi:hypothetical protein